MAWVFWNINSPQWHSPFNKNIPPSPSLKVPPTRDQVFTYEFTGDIFIQTTKSHSLAPISCGYILVQNAFSQTSKVPVVFLSQCCLRVLSLFWDYRYLSIAIYYKIQKSITYFQHIIPTYNILRKYMGNTWTKQDHTLVGQISIPLVTYLISSSYYSSTVQLSCLQSLSDWVHRCL